MKLLAFDTSTDQMSVAVQRTLEGVPQVWSDTAVGGAHTSANLIPTIERLMAQAGLSFEQLDVIAFGCGPGSFTGLRTACAVAQGLAFGVNIPVLPVDTLLAVAEEARHQHAPAVSHWQVTAVLDARMDELYTADYAFDQGQWTQTRSAGLVQPEQLACEPQATLAGNVFAAYGERLPVHAAGLHTLPTATAMLRLAPGLLAAGAGVPANQALPHYIRDKVAKTTLERAAEKAAL